MFVDEPAASADVPVGAHTFPVLLASPASDTTFTPPHAELEPVAGSSAVKLKEPNWKAPTSVDSRFCSNLPSFKYCFGEGLLVMDVP